MMTFTFGLLVIRHPLDVMKYCLVNEGKRGWWLPGGGVDGHETFEEGARREALEEAGAEVEENLSLLRVEVSLNRLRYILTGKAKNDKLKTIPDKESQGASWMTLEETQKLGEGKFSVPNSYLRGSEPLEWFSYLHQGGKSVPLDGFVERSVEKGATGIELEGRSAFKAELVCVLAILIVSTGEFLIDPAYKELRLPRFTPDLRAGETLTQCAERGLEELGFTNSLTGVLCLRDVRNIKNELDFRAAFLVVANERTKGKTAKPEAFSDTLDCMTIQRALKRQVAPLDVIGME